ncbi:RidA family protein [Niabella aquatica]
MSKDNILKVVRLNPKSISAPVGKYSHVTVIPKNSDLYTFSGQIGVDNNGNIPESLNEQVHNTFKNIEQILESQNLTPDDIIKVNIWATEDIDWDSYIQNGKIYLCKRIPQ